MSWWPFGPKKAIYEDSDALAMLTRLADETNKKKRQEREAYLAKLAREKDQKERLKEQMERLKEQREALEKMLHPQLYPHRKPFAYPFPIPKPDDQPKLDDQKDSIDKLLSKKPFKPF